MKSKLSVEALDVSTFEVTGPAGGSDDQVEITPTIAFTIGFTIGYTIGANT